jgi:hypothetical protein
MAVEEASLYISRISHYVNYIIGSFEVFTAMTMKNAVFLDVAPCRSCVNQLFGGTYRLHLQRRQHSTLPKASPSSVLILSSETKFPSVGSCTKLSSNCFTVQCVLLAYTMESPRDKDGV